MTKKRRRRPSRRKAKKKDSPLWQWVVVAVAAFLLYKGIDYFLAPEKIIPEKRKISVHSVQKEPEATRSPEGEPLSQWTFESAARFLPEGAFPDNYQAVPIGKKHGALLAYAKKINGKTPGPQGMTNTQPGLRSLLWDGKKYQPQELSFEDLAPALGSVSAKKFVGLPQLDPKATREGDQEIYAAKIFLSGDDREVTAFLLVDEDGAHWAPLNHASGKKMPAAFLLGTTQDKTRDLKQEKFDGKFYLILENGVLNQFKAYEGFQWNLQAYYWNGKHFVYDKNYSEKLTREKQLSHH